MHLPTRAATRSDDDARATPRQLHLFGEPRSWRRPPGMLTAALVAAAGAFAVVYAAKTFVQRSTAFSGDVLDEERFEGHSPAHAGFER